MDSTDKAFLLWPTELLAGNEGKKGEAGADSQLLDDDPPTVVEAEKDYSEGSLLL
jgi:hypothetical protein